MAHKPEAPARNPLISVIAQHRGADIYFDGFPAEGLSTITVEVANSSETLVVRTHEDYSGTIFINGSPIAAWEHAEDDLWEYTDFDLLRPFTS